MLDAVTQEVRRVEFSLGFSCHAYDAQSVKVKVSVAAASLDHPAVMSAVLFQLHWTLGSTSFM